MERTIRVERILIQSPLTDDVGALNQQNLVSTLHLQQRISSLLRSHNTPCIQEPDGRCFVLSPLAFWDHNENAILSDANILDTLSLSNNVSIAGIHVTPHMVLAGRGGSEHVAAIFDFAQFLALSYFFPEEDCSGKSGHAVWLKLLQDVTQNDELLIQGQEPRLIALEVRSSSSIHFSLLMTTIVHSEFIQKQGNLRNLSISVSRIRRLFRLCYLVYEAHGCGTLARWFDIYCTNRNRSQYNNEP
jgi:hypothetical protein